MSCQTTKDSPKLVLKLLRALWKLDADKQQLKSETQKIQFFPRAFVATSDVFLEQLSQQQVPMPTCPWTH